ncbi:hypothetical protein ACFLZ7_01305 [Nanoarchaeota archaeon]
MTGNPIGAIAPSTVKTDVARQEFTAQDIEAANNSKLFAEALRVAGFRAEYESMARNHFIYGPTHAVTSAEDFVHAVIQGEGTVRVCKKDDLSVKLAMKSGNIEDVEATIQDVISRPEAEYKSSAYQGYARTVRK